MPFCEFSNEVIAKDSTDVENIFISDFLPNASGECVKVYLYGLYKCRSSKDNDLSSMARALNLSEEDVLSVFYYWQELGLVNVINVEPKQVKYLPIKNALSKMKKYNVDKYSDFNISAQELIGTKMLTPREFEELYFLVENMHIEKDAVLKIIEYCVKLKGKNVSVSYISAVAKNWAYDGVRTIEDVDNRLKDQERITGDVVVVLKALGIKREATFDEYEQYLEWTKNLEIPLDIITHIAKVKKVKNFVKLDALINKCYSSRILSIKEIDEYFAREDSLYDTAKVVVKNLGLWYDNLENVVDTYISAWEQLGFEKDAIVMLSNFCFRSGIRNLGGMDTTMQNMYRLGLLTSSAIDNYMADIVKNDGTICQILEKLGITRGVTAMDRNMFKTWVNDWNISTEILDYAVELSAGQYSAMQYLNRVLSQYHSAGVKTLQQAKDFKLMGSVSSAKPNSTKSIKDAKQHEYTKQQLDSLFDDIMEVEI